jgi:N-formylglutamate amidohydrolase
MSSPVSFEIVGSPVPQHPVVLSVPHAGRHYPAEAGGLLRLGRAQLLPLEDRYADLLIDEAVAQGARAIVARTPRLWIDLNRDEREFDREMIAGVPESVPQITAKVRGGLGLIPRKISGGGDIWRRRLTPGELEARIALFHRPYHEAVAQMLAETRARFGVAVLLDLHSMPPLPIRDAVRPAQLVVGDRFGKSAASRFTAAILYALERHGLSAAVNSPYSGGHLLDRHGKPQEDVHALQLEIDRQLYLDPTMQQPSAGIGTIRHLVAQLVSILASEAGAAPFAIAAE